MAANLFLLPALQQPCQHTRWDEEGVSLLKLHSLASISSVSKEDVALLPWQDPVLIKGQVMRGGGHQPKHLRRSTRSNSETVQLSIYRAFQHVENYKIQPYFKFIQVYIQEKPNLYSNQNSHCNTHQNWIWDHLETCKVVLMCYHPFFFY